MERSLIEERRRAILRKIESEGRMNASELAKLFSTTPFTIRRDLIYLEDAGLIIRTHGGAARRDREDKSVWQVTSISSRLNKNAETKERIASFASTLINDNESLMIDGGSTTEIFSSHLIDKHNLLAVTISPRIAEILLTSEDNRVLMIGGELIKDTHLVSGPDAEENLSRYYVDKCVIGVTGAETGIGCYAAIPDEAGLKKLMIAHSKQCILLADHTKFRRRGFCFAFPLSAVQTLVTDSMIDDKTVNKLEEEGIKVYAV